MYLLFIVLTNVKNLVNTAGVTDTFKTCVEKTQCFEKMCTTKHDATYTDSDFF